MAKPMRRASMRIAIKPLWRREGRSHANGLKTTARIDTTIKTVISVLSIFDERDQLATNPLETSHT
ncbi:hypothetical protein [Pseudomonas sp. LD120]|uniref:hypothetical protein n=1 Tax=Pseudomonas sp. LD120 TaxID=485751 RepID=UPI002114169E|nr:hypothetical protein [Pseudomonas sp. LD120]